MTRRDELLAQHRAFIDMASDLLQILRGTDDASCSVCGAASGAQHLENQICHELVKWRRVAQHGSYHDAS